MAGRFVFWGVIFSTNSKNKAKWAKSFLCNWHLFVVSFHHRTAYPSDRQAYFWEKNGAQPCFSSLFYPPKYETISDCTPFPCGCQVRQWLPPSAQTRRQYSVSCCQEHQFECSPHAAYQLASTFPERVFGFCRRLQNLRA